MQTLEDLLTLLDGEYSWRLKELISMRSLVSQEDIKKSQIFIRTSLVFLYAHWEGFIRKATEYYLEYINEQGHNYEEINYNLTALALKHQGLQLEQKSDNIDRYFKAVNFILNRSSIPVRLPASKVIKDPSVLNSELFKNLLEILGLSEEHYQLKKKKLDEILIKERHDIAHGKRNNISIGDFNATYDMVVNFLEYFKDQLYISALETGYLNKAKC